MRIFKRNLWIIAPAVLLQACGGSLSASNDSGRVVASKTDLNLEWQSLGLLTPVITFSLSLIGTVSPPVVSGTTLQANDVFVEGTTAYISYNVAGNTMKGAVDQITTLLNIPLLGSQTTFPTAKVNGVFKNGGALYTVGASSALSAPALLSKFSIISNLLPLTLTPTATATLGSYAGVGVIQRGTSIYGVSGDDATNGGVTVLDSNLNQTAFLAARDARGIGYSILGTGDMYVVAAQPGRILDVSTAGALVRTIPLGGATTPESKSTIQVGRTMMVATVGEAGTRVVCISDGTVLASVAAPTVTGLTADRTVTNAATAGPGLLFVANGEAGVYVYSMKNSAAASGVACSSVTLTLLGTINFGAPISVNTIKYVNGILYVGSGLGGFRMVAVVAPTTTFDNTDFI